MATAGRARNGRSARRGTAVLLALPTALWYLLFLVAPLVVLVVMSVGERSPNGGYAPGFTFTQYAALPTRFTPLVNTLGLAALNTTICAIVAFPVAYTLALKVRGTWKLVLVALVFDILQLRGLLLDVLEVLDHVEEQFAALADHASLFLEQREEIFMLREE